MDILVTLPKNNKINMKKITMYSMVGLIAAFSANCGSNKTNEKSENNMVVQDKALDFTAMDTSVRPQDDFYNYVNGNWMKTAKIPADKPTWGSFHMLREKTDENSLAILNNLLKENFEQGSEGQKIKNLYECFIDWKQRNANGLKPIEADLGKIDAIVSLADFQKYIEESTLLGKNPLFGWAVYADLKNSNQNAVYLASASLGLGRDYYQKENEANTKTLSEYSKYVASILKMIGYNNPEQTAKNIVDFEKKIAKTFLTNEQIRNANLRYNPQTMAELSQLVKNVNLPQYLENVKVKTNIVIIGELEYYKQLDQFISQNNLPLLKDYLKYNLVTSNAQNLNQELDNLHFDFYGKYLQGQQEQRAMDKRGLALINNILGEAFGKLYVQKYFPTKNKEEMIILVDYLKKSFAHHIENLKWMSETTKEKALQKLNKFVVKIGYPDKWEDYSKLTILSEEQGGTLYNNLKNILQWDYNKDLEKIGKAVDKTKWSMAPQTVNAYYNPLYNEIVFPAAILQPPFFNVDADPAVNFGGIGAVIGHEMTHGFDDSGSLFDSEGNLVNWWTDQDKANFERVTEALAKQYDQYEPVKGSFVNGKFTNGENIADLGGVAIAYDALQLYLKDKGAIGKISNFTQDQRFFLSWATIWRTLSTEQYLVNQVKTDPHSPGYFRSFGPLINVDAFYDAFDVKPGDKHYKKPEERIKIW